MWSVAPPAESSGANATRRRAADAVRGTQMMPAATPPTAQASACPAQAVGFNHPAATAPLLLERSQRSAGEPEDAAASAARFKVLLDVAFGEMVVKATTARIFAAVLAANTAPAPLLLAATPNESRCTAAVAAAPMVKDGNEDAGVCGIHGGAVCGSLPPLRRDSEGDVRPGTPPAADKSVTMAPLIIEAPISCAPAAQGGEPPVRQLSLDLGAEPEDEADEQPSLRGLKLRADALAHVSWMQLRDERDAHPREHIRTNGVERAVAWGCVELIEKVGEGSYGWAYTAIMPVADLSNMAAGYRFERERVVIKRMKNRGLQGDVYDSFISEMVALEDCACRHVIRMLSASHRTRTPVHGFDSLGGSAALALEWAEQGSVADMMKRFLTTNTHLAGLPLEHVCRIMADAHLGLEHMHAKGWLHCDIKAANLLVMRNGDVKLGDMGLAGQLFAGDGVFRLGPPGVGTNGFAPKETGMGLYSPATDTFALAMTGLHAAHSKLFAAFYNAMKADGLEAALAALHVTLRCLQRDACNGSIVQFNTKDATLVYYFCDLVVRMTAIEPSQRLSRASYIKGHPFFGGIDWARLKAGALPSPMCMPGQAAQTEP